MSEGAKEFSAGGVIVRDGECVVIVPTRRAADGSKVVALPKGHPDGEETALEAALREVREEAGVLGSHVADLGEVSYWYQRKGKRIQKSVAFFLLAYEEGDVADHDHEVERAWWMPLAEAAKALTYPGERQMVQKALLHLQTTE